MKYLQWYVLYIRYRIYRNLEVFYELFYIHHRLATIVIPEEYEDRWTRISVIINTGSASIYMDGQNRYQSVSVSASTLTSGSILQLYVVGSTGMLTIGFVI